EHSKISMTARVHFVIRVQRVVPRSTHLRPQAQTPRSLLVVRTGIVDIPQVHHDLEPILVARDRLCAKWRTIHPGSPIAQDCDPSVVYFGRLFRRRKKGMLLQPSPPSEKTSHPTRPVRGIELRLESSRSARL